MSDSSIVCRGLKWLFAWLLALAPASLATTAFAAEAIDNEARVIVKFRHDASLGGEPPQPWQALGRRLRMTLTPGIAPAPRLRVLRAKGVAREHLIARLTQDSAIEWALPDRVKQAHSLPNDLALGGRDQWYLRPPGYIYRTQAPATAAIDAQAAWDNVGGGAGVVVAVLDSGIRSDHEDLAGNLVPGYDFISFSSTSADGDGREADAADPGDGRSGGASSWHGTRTAGVIAAVANNGVGVAGIAWAAKVLPLRVLGQGGGYDSDIVAAMRWAAGLPVAGIPANPNPAKVLNLSLGGVSSCSPLYQEAIDEVVAHGALVVVSTGNEGGTVDEPANCRGVLAVSGVRHVGAKVGYSSFGVEAGIAAPAGNCVNVGNGEECLFAIDTTTNLGKSTPGLNGYTTRINPNANIGTSFSAPIAAGVAALMAASNPQLSPLQLRDRIKRSARAFPVEANLPFCVEKMPLSAANEGKCNCTPSSCGAGLLNAAAAVNLARHPANLALPPVAAISPRDKGLTGIAIELDARGSFAAPERVLLERQWSFVAGPHMIEPTQANAALSAFVPPHPGTYTYRLLVTDDAGTSASAQQTFEVAAAPGYVTTTTTTTTTTTSTTTTTLPTLQSSGGWNLLGNGYSHPIDVATKFGNAAEVQAVWKWLSASGSDAAGWAFYAPSFADGGKEYALGKGYRHLTTIAGGEGFWVNAKTPFGIVLPGGQALGVGSLASAVRSGWSLLALGEQRTPAAFATTLGVEIASLWAWDNSLGAWYFYSPTLASQGALAGYIAGKGYLDFDANAKTLAPGMGFWLNRP